MGGISTVVHGNRGAAMETKPPFEPQTLLAKANGGRTICTYRRNQIVFSQGELADSIFYIHEGELKLAVLSEQGKEAIVAILGACKGRGRRGAGLSDGSVLVARRLLW
jgi:CRP-like cAMP-binding protein